jgi:pimeloyl-ACP methyl ester carboxylesterase
MAEALHKALPQSTLTVIMQGRHITPVECPQEIARELKKLLKV